MSEITLIKTQLQNHFHAFISNAASELPQLRFSHSQHFTRLKLLPHHPALNSVMFPVKWFLDVMVQIMQHVLSLV